MVMSDRVAVIHHGTIQQLDTPRRVHESPANGFTARFVGETNSAQGYVLSASGNEAHLQLDANFAVRGITPGPIQHGDRRSMFVRPERVRIGDAAEKLDNRAQGTVRRVTYLGDRTIVLVELADGLIIAADLGVAGDDSIPALDTGVTVGWSVEHCLLLET
jgi:putative spermidine/putrescine transport system ATP-binding protein